MQLEPSPAGAGATGSGSERLQGLSRKAGLNALASGLDYGARTVVEFVLNPILVSGLGTGLYGVWRVLWRLTGYLWATTGRSAQALQSAIANRLHSDDLDEKRRLVGAATLVSLAFVPVLAAATGVLAWLLPDLLEVAPQDAAAVRWAIVLLGIDSIALSLLTLPRSVLQGENHGYRRMGASAVLVVIGGAATAAAVWLDWGLVGVATANLAGTLVAGAMFWQVTRRHVPWFGAARPQRAEVRWFFGLSGWFMLWKLVNQLMIAGDVVVLGALASVEAVSVYSLTKFVPEAVLPLLSMLVMGGVPGLGGVIGAGEFERARRIRAEVMAITWIIATAASVSVLVWNRTFVELWVGGEFFAGDTELLLIMVTLLQLGIIRNDAFIIDLTLEVRGKVLVGLASAVVSLGIAGLLIAVWDLGISGLCIGLLLGRAMLSLLYPRMVGRAIGHPMREQLGAAVRPLLTTVVLFAGAALAGSRRIPGGWPVLVIGSALTGAATVVVAAYAGLDAAHRTVLTRRLRTLAGRLR